MSVLLANSDETEEREYRFLDLFEQQRVAGLLVSPVGLDLEELRKTRDRGTPVVLVDRESEDKSFSSVSVDDFAGGQMAVEHLISIGKKKIMFAGGPVKIQQISDRLDGAKKAAAVKNVSLEIFETKNLTVLEGRAVGQEILGRPADNDLLAIGIMQALIVSPDVLIPKDIALVGYDDISFAGSLIIPLTSIRQPSMLIGAQAVELLMEETEKSERSKPRQILFQPELVVRSSTKS
jgi:LacI family transcriptional regulator